MLYSENGELEVIVRDFCTSLYAKGNRSIYLLSFLIDLLDAVEKSTEPENLGKVRFALQVCIYVMFYQKLYHLQFGKQ